MKNLNKLYLFIFLVIFLIVFIHEGINKRDSYLIKNSLDNDILQYFNTLEDDTEVRIYSIQNEEIPLSYESLMTFVEAVHTVREFGPNHPVNRRKYYVDFSDSNTDYIIELICANIGKEEIAYLNVIVTDEENNELYRFNYYSDKLQAWTENNGLCKN